MADVDEVAKGDLRAATYPELALRTPLTRNGLDRVDYMGKSPRGERAQPGIYVKIYYSRRSGIDDANKHVHQAAELHSRTRPYFSRPKKPRRTTPPPEEQHGRGKAVSFRPWSASDVLRRGLEFYTLVRLEGTSRISVERDPWGLYASETKQAVA